MKIIFTTVLLSTFIISHIASAQGLDPGYGIGSVLVDGCVIQDANGSYLGCVDVGVDARLPASIFEEYISRDECKASCSSNGPPGGSPPGSSPPSGPGPSPSPTPAPGPPPPPLGTCGPPGPYTTGEGCCVDLRLPDRETAHTVEKDFECFSSSTGILRPRIVPNNNESLHIVAWDAHGKKLHFHYFDKAEPDDYATDFLLSAQGGWRSDVQEFLTHQISFTYPTRGTTNPGDEAISNSVVYETCLHSFGMVHEEARIFGTVIGKKISSNNPSLKLHIHNFGTFEQREKIHQLLPIVKPHVENRFAEVGIDVIFTPVTEVGHLIPLEIPSEVLDIQSTIYEQVWRPDGVNVVVAWDIEDSTGWHGLSAGAPGAALRSKWSAVVVNAFNIAGSDGDFSQEEIEIFATTLLHEAAHYLGLNHTNEHDLPEAGYPIPALVGGCDNIMYPFPTSTICNSSQTPINRVFNPAQAEVMKFHPLVK